MVSQILKILHRFEENAVDKIKILKSGNINDYEEVRELKTIQSIRKAIISHLYNKPPKHRYTIDDLIIHPRINI